jgi:hypothetical protein
MDLVKESIIKAGAVTVLVLALGILLGYQMDDLRQDHLSEELRQSNLETETFSVLDNYVQRSDRDHCQLMEVQIPSIGERNGELGSELERFEAQNIGSDEEYRYIRDRYYNNQLRLYMALNSYKDRCNGTNQTTVLYFFDDSTESQRQGAVLNEVVKQKNVQVFSFNAEVDDSLIVDVLTEDFNVTEYPTVIVNDDQKFEGFISENELNYDVINGNQTE